MAGEGRANRRERATVPKEIAQRLYRKSLYNDRTAILRRLIAAAWRHAPAGMPPLSPRCVRRCSSLERHRARRRDCSSPWAFQPSSLSGFELPRCLKGCRNGPSLRPDAGEAHAPLSTTPSSTDQLPSALPLPSESASGSV